MEVATVPGTEGRSPEEEELKAQATAAGGEEPLDGEDTQEEPPAIPQLALEGFGSGLTMKAGGAAPDKSTVKLSSASVAIPEGEFQRGDTVDLIVRVRCTEVAFIDKVDHQSGQTIEVERRHKMRPINVERLDR